MSLRELVRHGMSPEGNVAIYGHRVVNNPTWRFHTRKLLISNHCFGLLSFPLTFQIAGLCQASNSLLQEIFLQLWSDIVEAVVLHGGHQLYVSNVIVIRSH